jgi:hypothetical protein
MDFVFASIHTKWGVHTQKMDFVFGGPCTENGYCVCVHTYKTGGP